MKICIAQTNPVKGDIPKNISSHLTFIERAHKLEAGIIVFPELSLTGYEPELARELATTQDDARLNILQETSNRTGMTICAGLPTRQQDALRISMIIFRPDTPRLTYSKQFLYPTEQGIFTPGENSLSLSMNDNIIISPAICYELSIPDHSAKAAERGANVYIASVLNSVGGVDADIEKLSAIAQKYSMTVFMANYTGFSGGYECAGKSSVWNRKGELIAQLGKDMEGILVYDTDTSMVIKEER